MELSDKDRELTKKIAEYKTYHPVETFLENVGKMGFIEALKYDWKLTKIGHSDEAKALLERYRREAKDRRNAGYAPVTYLDWMINEAEQIMRDRRRQALKSPR